MIMKKLNPLALGYAGAVVSSACMLILSLLANGGFYTMTAMRMSEWHMFYSPSVGGTFTGMVEAAVISFIGLYAFGVVYNWFVEK